MSAVDKYGTHSGYFEEASADESDDTKNKKTKGGSSCHQCKSRRNFSALTYCTAYLDKKSKKCRKKFCSHCLKKFYRESAATTAAEKQTWVCPSCRRICCCAACRRRKDKDDGPIVMEQPLIEHHDHSTVAGDHHHHHHHHHHQPQQQQHLFHQHQYNNVNNVRSRPGQNDDDGALHQNKRQRPAPGGQANSGYDGSTLDGHPNRTTAPPSLPNSPAFYPYNPVGAPANTRGQAAPLHPRFSQPARSPFFGPAMLSGTSSNDINTGSMLYRDASGSALNVTDLFQLDPSVVTGFITRKAQSSKGRDSDRFNLLYEFANSDVAKQRISSILLRPDLDRQGKVSAVADLLRTQLQSIENNINLALEQQLQMRFQQQQQLLSNHGGGSPQGGLSDRTLAQSFFYYSPEIQPLADGSNTSTINNENNSGNNSNKLTHLNHDQDRAPQDSNAKDVSATESGSSSGGKWPNSAHQYSPALPNLSGIPPLPLLGKDGNDPFLLLHASSRSNQNTPNLTGTNVPTSMLTQNLFQLTSSALAQAQADKKADLPSAALFVGSPLVPRPLANLDSIPALPTLRSSTDGGGVPGNDSKHLHHHHHHHTYSASGSHTALGQNTPISTYTLPKQSSGSTGPHAARATTTSHPGTGGGRGTRRGSASISPSTLQMLALSQLTNMVPSSPVHLSIPPAAGAFQTASSSSAAPSGSLLPRANPMATGAAGTIAGASTFHAATSANNTAVRVGSGSVLPTPAAAVSSRLATTFRLLSSAPSSPNTTAAPPGSGNHLALNISIPGSPSHLTSFPKLPTLQATAAAAGSLSASLQQSAHLNNGRRLSTSQSILKFGLSSSTTTLPASSTLDSHTATTAAGGSRGQRQTPRNSITANPSYSGQLSAQSLKMLLDNTSYSPDPSLIAPLVGLGVPSSSTTLDGGTINGNGQYPSPAVPGTQVLSASQDGKDINSLNGKGSSIFPSIPLSSTSTSHSSSAATSTNDTTTTMSLGMTSNNVPVALELPQQQPLTTSTIQDPQTGVQQHPPPPPTMGSEPLVTGHHQS